MKARCSQLRGQPRLRPGVESSRVPYCLPGEPGNQHTMSIPWTARSVKNESLHFAPPRPEKCLLLPARYISVDGLRELFDGAVDAVSESSHCKYVFSALSIGMINIAGVLYECIFLTVVLTCSARAARVLMIMTTSSPRSSDPCHQ